jgi:6-phosphofructokinase 1
MPQKQKPIGILTGGGDCPGLNAVIRAVVRKAVPMGYPVYGLLRGWEGVLKRKKRLIKPHEVSGILRLGGTILQTSRTNPYQDKKTEAQFRRSLKALDLHALVAVGGEDTLGVAAKIAKTGYPVVGVPKTIDNDLMGTDMTFGFDTAVSIATEAIDRLHTTAESHNRVIVLEVMGRHAGWIATYAGLAGGADDILIPEIPFRIADICEIIHKRHRRGKKFSIIVVSEGAQWKKEEGKELVLASQEKDAFGHVKLGGIGHVLAQEIEALTGFESRAAVLGHIQRGGNPTAFDRILATRYGIRAVELIAKKKFGRMVALRGSRITDVPLSIVSKKIKTVDQEIFKVAETFFG